MFRDLPADHATFLYFCLICVLLVLVIGILIDAVHGSPSCGPHGVRTIIQHATGADAQSGTLVICNNGRSFWP